MHIELVALIVDDYDAAVDFFVERLGFELVEDSPSLTNDGRRKRCGWRQVRDLTAGRVIRRFAVFLDIAQTDGISSALPERPGFVPELLAHSLKRRPGPTIRSRLAEPDLLEAFAGAEIGKLELEPPAMMLKELVFLWREPSLGERPIPLGRRRLGRVSEVERRDDRATLPATVRRRGRASQQIRALRRVTDPDAADRASYGRGGHRGLGDAGMSNLSDQPGTRRYSPRAISSISFSSSSAMIGR